MALVRLFQISDLHLGRPFAWLSAERREQRRRDQQHALEQAVSQAIERGCHALLVPGDLFDTLAVDAASLTFAVKAFAVTGCPPVFISPGNHDPASPDHPAWNPRLLAGRGLTWPAHVHVFTSPQWSSAPVARMPDVRVWGRAATSNVDSTDRPLAREMLEGLVTPEPSRIDVAVFHGSREDRCPPGQKITAPFSDDEVAASPFAYHAVGHYHVASRIEQGEHCEGMASAGARLAYAGSAVALDLTETGSHGALEVRIEFGHRVPFVEVEPVELDRRRVVQAHADVTGCASADQIDRRLLKALDGSGAGEGDLVVLTLSGRLAPGLRWTAPGPDVRARAFHLRAKLDGLRPDHDLAALRDGDGRTTEERFARELMTRIEAAPDAEQREALERALWYGLDAFRLREVAPLWDEVTG